MPSGRERERERERGRRGGGQRQSGDDTQRHSGRTGHTLHWELAPRTGHWELSTKNCISTKPPVCLYLMREGPKNRFSRQGGVIYRFKRNPPKWARRAILGACRWRGANRRDDHAGWPCKALCTGAAPSLCRYRRPPLLSPLPVPVKGNVPLPTGMPLCASRMAQDLFSREGNVIYRLRRSGAK